MPDIGGTRQEVWGMGVPSGVQGQSPDLGDKVPRSCKLLCIFVYSRPKTPCFATQNVL